MGNRPEMMLRATKFQKRLQQAQRGGSAILDPVARAKELDRLLHRFEHIRSAMELFRGAIDTTSLEGRIGEIDAAAAKKDLGALQSLVPRLEGSFESTSRIYVKTALLQCELKVVELEAGGLDPTSPRPHLEAAKAAKAAGAWNAAVREVRLAEGLVAGLQTQQIEAVLDDTERLLDLLEDRGSDPGELRPKTQEAWALLHENKLDEALDLAVQTYRDLSEVRDGAEKGAR